MVIYDNKENGNGLHKGILYLSLIDVDYIVGKYGVDHLNSLISNDYVECFIDKLEQVKNDGKLSDQYYLIVSLGVETEEDEKLLNLISEEVKNGILFTKRELSSLTIDDLNKRLKDMEYVRQNLDVASLEEVYKYRSYEMAKFIDSTIKNANEKCKKMYEAQASGNRIQFDLAYRDYLNGLNNLEYLGLSADIYESDYFEKQLVMVKKES